MKRLVVLLAAATTAVIPVTIAGASSMEPTSRLPGEFCFGVYPEHVQQLLCHDESPHLPF